jgi:hypothetical protein
MKKTDLMNFLSSNLPVSIVFGRYLSDSDLTQNSEKGYCALHFVDSHNMYTDDRIYQKIEVADLELITKQIEPIIEQQIEDVLDTRKEFGAFTKGQVYSKEEKIYITAYEFDVMLEKETYKKGE